MVRRGFANTTQGQLHYREAGNGPPLVLVHETARSSDGFRYVYERLGQRYRVLGLDTPGFGQSYHPASPPGIAGYAESIVAFLDALGIVETALLGFHTGAGIAAEAAVRYPERFSALLLCGLPDYSPERRAESLRHQTPLHVAGDGSHLTKLWSGVPSVRRFWGDIENVNAYILDAAQAIPNAHWAHIALLEQDIRQVLPRIRARTLVFCSKLDAFAPLQDGLVRLLPNGSGTVIDESEKFPMYTAPDRFCAVIEAFLGEP